MLSWPILSMIIFTPFIGAFAIAFNNSTSTVLSRNALQTGIFTSVCTMVFALIMWRAFDTSIDGIQFIENIEISPSFFVDYTLGVDGLSLFFVVLTTVVTVLAMLGLRAGDSIKTKEVVISFLILEGVINGALLSQNVMLFLLFFEGALFPLYILIGLLGGKNSHKIAIKFAVFAALSSTIMLPSLIMIVFRTGTGYMPDLMGIGLSGNLLTIIWWALFASFAMRLPVFPLHSWYKDILENVSLPVIMFIVAVFCKLGVYGLMRFNVIMFPHILQDQVFWINWILLSSVVYALGKMLLTTNIKVYVGYVAMVLINVLMVYGFSLSQSGMNSVLFINVLYTILGAGFFVVLAQIHKSTKTFDIYKMGGLYTHIPHLAIAFFLLIVSLLGMPFTAGFPALLLNLNFVSNSSDLFVYSFLALFLMTIFMMIYLYSKVFWGSDINKNFIFAPVKIYSKDSISMGLIFIFLIATGLFPNLILSYTNTFVLNIFILLSDIAG